MRKWLLVSSTVLTTLSMVGGPLAPTARAGTVANETVDPSPNQAQDESWWERNWAMAGANPQRTSWVPTSADNETEIRGALRPLWYRSFVPYVNYKTQVIAANDALFVTTAKGLYAFSTEDVSCTNQHSYQSCNDGLGGDLLWVFPTELALGHSPTVVNHPTLGPVVYVGGYDHTLYALDGDPDTDFLPRDPVSNYPLNNSPIWTFTAGDPIQDPDLPAGDLGAGFETNPLVADDTVFVGNRNGYFYALDGPTGALRWRFRTDGPILFSAAYKNGVVYFASNDAHAYAVSSVDANNDHVGDLVWQSAKLPGDGFFSYWPVVYTEPRSHMDYVIFGGGEGYSDDTQYSGIGVGSLSNTLDLEGLYTNPDIPYGDLVGPSGNEPGDWGLGTVTINASRAAQYLESSPHRRRYFVLEAATGHEFTFDSDLDGKPEYAPVTWHWTHSGSRYPAVIGGDGVLYQSTSYISNQYIPQGGISGWKFGTQHISRVHQGNYGAVDEPLAHSAGGNLIYWSLVCDREAGAYDITMPFGSGDRYWEYYDYNLGTVCPGLNSDCSVYGGEAGVYASHGAVNPPIPYHGKLYSLNSNALIAWGIAAEPPARLSSLSSVNHDQAISISVDQLKLKLASEVQKITQAGHLRPGFYSSVSGEGHLGGPTWNFLLQYFHNPGDTLVTLTRALPYLPQDSQQQTRDYLRQEYLDYHQFDHIGWKNGAPREAFDTPPEIQERMNTTATADPSDPYVSPERSLWESCYRYYGMWKYAQEFGNAVEVLNEIRGSLPNTMMSDQQLLDHPYAHNAYIAGYWAYLELQKSAGEPESAAVRAELNRLLALRSDHFSIELPYGWEAPLNIAANFMFLTPELADYLNEHAYAQVAAAVATYEDIAPGWFVSKYGATKGEGSLQLLYDYPALFQAKAYILKEPREELVKYLDVPAFERGDLFYIQNLVAAIEAGSIGPAPTFADVPPSHTYYREIEALYRAGYTAGCNTSPLMYCPDQIMNRAESAVFVERGVHTASYDPGTPASQVFADLSLDSWAAKWVNGLWVDQYTAGCGTNPLVYCPWQGHTRAEGCVFYLRMLHGASFEPPPPTQQTFADVPLDAWYAKWVQAAYDAGLLAPCQASPELRFCPNDPLTRALAAYMMVQAKGLR